MRAYPIKEMDRLATEFDGMVSYYIKDLATGLSHEYRADQRLPTASICKMSVMVELFNQVNRGKLSLDDRHTLPSDGISRKGTGVLSGAEDPPTLTLRDYCRLMITVSDNMETDFLIGLLGTDHINATMDDMGYHNTRTTMTIGQFHYSMRHLTVRPGPAGDAMLDEIAKTMPPDPASIAYTTTLDGNVTTSRDMGVMLERIYYGQAVSPQASWEMLDMLKDCQARTKIPRDLKPDVVVAHKIGGSNRIQGDVGIVLLPTGPLVVSAITLARQKDNSKSAQELIATLSRLAAETFSPESVVRKV